MILAQYGFDECAATSDLSDLFTFVSGGCSIEPTGGRFGGPCLRIANTSGTTAKVVGRSFGEFDARQSAGNRICMAGWVKVNSLTDGTSSSFDFLRVYSADLNYHLGLGIVDNTGVLSVRQYANFNGGWPTGVVINDGAWHWIELHQQLANSSTSSTGTVEVWVDGVKVYTQTTFQSNSINTGLLDQVQFAVGYQGGSGTTLGDFSYDDWTFWNDTAGDTAGDLTYASMPIGPSKITTLKPNGAGSSAQFTPNTGANYAAVDEVAADDDTTYNQSTASGQIDRFAFEDLAVTPTKIHAVVEQIRCKNPGTGSPLVKGHAKSGASVQVNSGKQVATSYWPVQTVFASDPATGAAWTVAGLNAAEFGYEAA